MKHRIAIAALVWVLVPSVAWMLACRSRGEWSTTEISPLPGPRSRGFGIVKSTTRSSPTDRRRPMALGVSNSIANWRCGPCVGGSLPDWNGEPLRRVVLFLEEKTHESFVLDPVARHAGTIKPEMPVSGSNDKEPVATALKKLLAPIGMTYVVRDEAIVLTRTP